MQTEFIRSLNCNYERILLDKKPQENRYQYCMLNRGGIKGLLDCSLRYINGVGYLYYDISSKQNIKQRYSNKCITREWIKDFLWNIEQIRSELGRFLLEDKNILWYPNQIFQDLEDHRFSFLYVPYYEGENGFHEFMEFLVDRIDYNDEKLVECVYHMYEQLEQIGSEYLYRQIFEDAKVLEKPAILTENEMEKDTAFTQTKEMVCEELKMPEESESKKYLFGLFDSKRRKNREIREAYQRNTKEKMYEYAVAEDSVYEQEYGRTLYIDAVEDKKRVLNTSEGTTLQVLDEDEIVIGKKKGEADVILEDASVSRLHARIVREGNDYFIEDMNSTNGTFKNGLRLNPYEKRELEEGDEIKIGRVLLRFD